MSWAWAVPDSIATAATAAPATRLNLSCMKEPPDGYVELRSKAMGCFSTGETIHRLNVYSRVPVLGACPSETRVAAGQPARGAPPAPRAGGPATARDPARNARVTAPPRRTQVPQPVARAGLGRGIAQPC